MKLVIRFLSAGMFATRPLLRYANAMQLEHKSIPVIIVLSRRRWSLAFRVRICLRARVCASQFIGLCTFRDSVYGSVISAIYLIKTFILCNNYEISRIVMSDMNIIPIVGQEPFTKWGCPLAEIMRGKRSLSSVIINVPINLSGLSVLQ
jgi:hypothetical protein